MNRRAISFVVGLASIASSSVVWIAVLLRHLPNPVFWNLSAATSLLLWGLGIVLALTAAWIGSRKWAWAALLPVGSVVLFFVLVNLLEPRGH
jgi:hypothetical protein